MAQAIRSRNSSAVPMAQARRRQNLDRITDRTTDRTTDRITEEKNVLEKKIKNLNMLNLGSWLKGKNK